MSDSLKSFASFNENNEVQKVLEFMKKESARSFVAPKS